MGRYRVEVHAAFEAAHHLLSYRGGMEPAHGHSWRVSVEIAASELDGEGMAFDFVAARHALLDLAGLLDHRDINTVPPFDTVESDDRTARQVVLRAHARAFADRRDPLRDRLGGPALQCHLFARAVDAEGGR